MNRMVKEVGLGRAQKEMGGEKKRTYQTSEIAPVKPRRQKACSKDSKQTN